MFTIFVHVARLFIVVAANQLQLNNNFANCCKFVKVTQSWQVKDVNSSVASVKLNVIYFGVTLSSTMLNFVL